MVCQLIELARVETSLQVLKGSCATYNITDKGQYNVKAKE